MATEQINQELEDAADKASLRIYAYESEPRINRDAKIGFIDGANWQKERSFSLMRWANLNDYTLSSEGWIQDTDSKPISDQELYSKWLQYTKQ